MAKLQAHVTVQPEQELPHPDRVPSAFSNLQAAASAAELLELDDSMTFDGRGPGSGGLWHLVAGCGGGGLASCGALGFAVAANVGAAAAGVRHPVAPCGLLWRPEISNGGRQLPL